MVVKLVEKVTPRDSNVELRQTAVPALPQLRSRLDENLGMNHEKGSPRLDPQRVRRKAGNLARETQSLIAIGLGGADRNRTCDLLIANETLYQLSYDPVPIAARIMRTAFGAARH